MTDSKNNTGYWNTGNSNTGNWNTGNRNTGYRNTGYRNTGDSNTGYWNTCDHETGYFNTEQADTIRVFNKDVSCETWANCDKPDFLYFDLTEWIREDAMTDQEKIENETYKTTGGYLKS
jgi:PPE-repeat protein